MLKTSRDCDKPIVAHYSTSFFQGSETFIYQYISHLRNFRPVCIAQVFVNLDQLPFPEDDLYSIFTRRYSFEWFYRGVNRRFLNRDPLLTRQLRKLECSLLHAHFGPNGCLAVASKKKLDLPLVTTFYGFDLSVRAHLEQYRDRYQVLFKEGDLFLTEGPFMRNRLIELGCPPEKVKVQRIAISVRSIEFN
jgi:colanic acid/amylovoran biosynthesis glycosyltransferase